MNQSPYFTGAAPNFGPPSGLAGLISQSRDQRIDMSGAQQFADVAEKYKQVQAQGKAADATVTAYPDLLSAAGMHPEQFKTLGARDKAAVVSGVVQAQAQKNVMQQMLDVAAQQKERSAQAGAAEGLGNFMQGAYAPLPAGTPDTFESRMAAGTKAMGQTPYANRALPAAVANLQKYYELGAGANNATAFDEDPVTGFRVARLGKQIIPSGTDPAKLSTTGPVTSDDNQFFFNGKTWMNKKGTEMTDTDKAKLIEQHNKAIDVLLAGYSFAKGDPEMETIYKQRIAGHNQAIATLGGKSGSASGIAPPTAPGPATPMTPPTILTKQQFDGLPSGTVYVGKDGKSYQKP